MPLMKFVNKHLRGRQPSKVNDGADEESSGAADAATTLDDTTGRLCNRDADGDGRPSSRGGLRVLLRQPPARLEPRYVHRATGAPRAKGLDKTGTISTMTANPRVHGS